jgi:hypothetical protein
MLTALALAATAATTAVLVPSTANAAGQAHYWADINTGNRAGAGTDDYVWIQLNGTDASSGWIYLDQVGRDDFETGRTDGFDLNLSDLGTVTSIDVSVSPYGKNPDWFLNGIALFTTNSAGQQSNRWFPWYGWLVGETQVHLQPTAL